MSEKIEILKKDSEKMMKKIDEYLEKHPKEGKDKMIKRIEEWLRENEESKELSEYAAKLYNEAIKQKSMDKSLWLKK